MPLIRTYNDIEEKLGNLTPAEARLMTACRDGETCFLGSTVPPEGTPSPDVHIRSDLLRYLITGGCDAHPVADQGVDLYGAFIAGTLDLNFATACGETTMMDCRFDSPIAARQAKLNMLALNNSEIPALIAEGAQVTGDVFLSEITAEAQVNLAGATIGGQLSCNGARFNATTGFALNAQGARVADALFLDKITAETQVCLAGATIGGQLSCNGAKFNAATGFALDAYSAQVKGGFFFRNVTCAHATIYLPGARADTLVDDPGSWPPSGRLLLEGFTYNRVVNTNFPKLSDRLDWLTKGDTWDEQFFPQPYTQLAKVYREMGHDAEARAILARRERLLRKDYRKRLLDKKLHPDQIPLQRVGAWLWAGSHWLFADVLLRWVAGYGHHPFRSVMALAILITMTIFPAHRAWEQGQFAPNNAPILVSDSWLAYHTTEANPAKVWSGETEPSNWSPPNDGDQWQDHAPGRDYETFNPIAYAADVVIPIIDFGQTDAWAPSTTRGGWGVFLWGWRWVATLLGWIVTALGAAAITGIIRRD